MVSRTSIGSIPTPLLDGEVLSPHQDSPTRQTTASTALWSLIATIIGGGVLALPLSMQKCGLVVGATTMILAAFLNDFTLDILVACARRTGTSSYEEVAQKSYGLGARLFTILVLVCMLWLVNVAYIIIVADLISPVVTILMPPGAQMAGNLIRLAVKIAACCAIAPLCYSRTMNALRFMSIVSVISVVFLTFAILMKSIPVLGHIHTVVVWTAAGSTETVLVHPGRAGLKLWPDSTGDFVYVFPTFIMALMCQYNILPTHSELAFPTRQRIRGVTHLTIPVHEGTRVRQHPA